MANLTHEQVQELVARSIAETTQELRTRVNDLTTILERLTTTDNIIPHSDVEIDPDNTSRESLELVKSLQQFDGENYVSWRTSVIHCMKAYEHCKGSTSYFTAVNILRNKITGKANDVLTSHGTPLHVDAIIGRLDLTYNDKRPVYLLQTELTNARQGNQTLQQFYDQVSKLLTLITNKTIMSYGPRTAETNVLIEVARENALRTFITGLNQPMSNLVFSLNPGDLPNALARAQEIEVNQSQRLRDKIDFSRAFPHKQMHQPMLNSNPRLINNNSLQNRPQRQNYQITPPTRRMDLGSGNYHQRPQTSNNNNNNNSGNNYNNNNQHRNFSSNQYRDQRFNNEIRNNNNPFKRDRPNSSQQPLNKNPRINNLEEQDNFLE